ncbi:uncharacterized protein B0T15DRAFT_136810 [Chaetomium strumarium]|uniref:Uncharacterized protein n=1 Tax=Chaetomium strumarium TaxID=1170767 RepID=A0AAJ0GUG8_9PEZI|nr:hypothetical protein B0T15DRAFT_136810 [Chaetomium strumarium]
MALIIRWWACGNQASGSPSLAFLSLYRAFIRTTPLHYGQRAGVRYQTAGSVVHHQGRSSHMGSDPWRTTWGPTIMGSAIGGGARGGRGKCGLCGTVGGTDQLIGDRTNQGHDSSSISTARHVPRPPAPTSDATCQTLRPASAQQISLHAPFPGCTSCSALCRAILDSRCHLEQMPPLRRIASSTYTGYAAFSPPSLLGCLFVAPAPSVRFIRGAMREMLPRLYDSTPRLRRRCVRR